jgi:hypothetical protein
MEIIKFNPLFGMGTKLGFLHKGKEAMRICKQGEKEKRNLIIMQVGSRGAAYYLYSAHAWFKPWSGY